VSVTDISIRTADQRAIYDPTVYLLRVHRLLRRPQEVQLPRVKFEPLG
jgi:hypothetical protein